MTRRNRNTRVEFPLELEHGNELVEYLVVAEVSPFIPGKLYGLPENCYPDEGNEVVLKEVYYVEGTKRYRRPELDELVTDGECVERAADQRRDEWADYEDSDRDGWDDG